MDNFERRVLNGARAMIHKHMLRIAQAGAGTNHKRRVNVARNYLDDLEKLRNYLYGGQSTVRNIQGFGRQRLNENITRARRDYTVSLEQYIHHLARNVIRVAGEMHREHMAGAPEFNKNWTVTQKGKYHERQARNARQVLNYVKGRVEAEPLLLQHNQIKRILNKFQEKINKWNSINRTVKTVQHRIRTMKRKFPGSF